MSDKNQFPQPGIWVNLDGYSLEQLRETLNKWFILLGGGIKEQRPNTLWDDIYNINNLVFNHTINSISTAVPNSIFYEQVDPFNAFLEYSKPFISFYLGLAEGANGSVSIRDIYASVENRINNEKMKEIQMFKFYTEFNNIENEYYKSCLENKKNEYKFTFQESNE